MEESMKTTLLLVLQFAGPVLIGLAITGYLRAVTIRLLEDVCGTRDRAEFWTRVVAVLIVCVPLALVLVVATSPLRCVADDAICDDLVVRQTLLATLVGSLLSVGSVAFVIARYLPYAQVFTHPEPAMAPAAQTSAEAA
jgi:hypothetical protein